MPRKDLLSLSVVNDMRLNSFGFSEGFQGDLERLYIPFLRDNQHIVALSLDMEKLQPRY